MKVNEQLESAFKEFIRPTLDNLGFSRIALKNCMCPEYLFVNGRIWFSLSWDWRDQYLDVSLGRLYWFKDVMPRVVVIGDFSDWDSAIGWNAVQKEGSFEAVFTKIMSVLPKAFENIENEYNRIYVDFRNTRGKRVNIDDFIGREADLGSLKKYMA